ncbi:MAG: large conductance mechanosensitive channel protein MscL [Clostridia bacterium]|nr:large conductance mechanosensitive channel protein MscL [Clostridia bacterium]
MKKFFEEFKKFITRGNVVDMAVGVIVGSSFTAIVNGMSNYILKPIINWLIALIFGKNSFAEIHTFLIKVTDDTGAIDLTQSIYIDWGAFINAVLNFLIVAFVLFTIVKIINRFREERKEFAESIMRGRLTRAERRELRKAGINRRDKEAVKVYFEEKKRIADEAAKKAEEEAAEKARLEREANPTTEDLLKMILEQIKANKA